MSKLEMRNWKLENTPSMVSAPARDFRGLDVWKLARSLRSLLYILVKRLAGEERFALNSQLRRALQSMDASIAD